MNITEQIKSQFKERVEIFEKSKKRLYVKVAKENAKEVVHFLFKDLGARMSIMTAVDIRPGIEILYHMAMDKQGVMVTVKTLAEKPNPEIPTVVDFLPGAEWIEREIHEMFGVNFAGNPKLERLLLPDDWPQGVFPLRKKTFESEQEGK
ncbi:MAG: NADH-quinone oxidoreductase subunit C [Candidatus Margulisiibacteriota bacterium]